MSSDSFRRLAKIRKKINTPKKSVVRRKDGYYRKGKYGRRIKVRSHNQRYYQRESLSDVIAQRERIQYYSDQMLRADELYRENLKLILAIMKERQSIESRSSAEYISDDSARANKVAVLNSRIIELEQVQTQHLGRFTSFSSILTNATVNPIKILETHGRIPHLLSDDADPLLDLADEFEGLLPSRTPEESPTPEESASGATDIGLV